MVNKFLYFELILHQNYTLTPKDPKQQISRISGGLGGLESGGLEAGGLEAGVVVVVAVVVIVLLVVVVVIVVIAVVVAVVVIAVAVGVWGPSLSSTSSLLAP